MLETARLRLRQFTPDDALTYAELLADAEVMRFIGGSTPSVDVAHAAERIARSTASYRSRGFGLLAVERLVDGELVGRVGFFVWDTETWSPRLNCDIEDSDEIELGWALARAAWGHGYATEAARAMRDYAFSELGLARLISLIHPQNARSLRLAERLGAIPDREIETARWGPAWLYLHRPVVPTTENPGLIRDRGGRRPS
jgi:RimJ/RimL family protein N-acetyltransferase